MRESNVGLLAVTINGGPISVVPECASKNCHPEEGFSPTKDLQFAGVEATAGEKQILRLRRANEHACAQDDNSFK